MSDCNIIYELLKNPDKETKNIDLKRSEFVNNLSEKAKKTKLIQEIVAFSNRFGGKLIVGANDDGTFEGWTLTDPDNLKGVINNVIMDNISPKLICNIEYYRCAEGDIILIDIPRKNRIPHARIVKTGDKIKYREYYIRTSHNISLISDNQLDYLFNEKEYNFKKSFRVSMIFDVPGYNLTNPFRVPQIKGIRRYFDRFLVEVLPKDFFKLLEENNFKFIHLIKELLSFYMLYSLLESFSGTWDVGFMKFGDSRLYTPKLGLPYTKIKIEDVLETLELKTLKVLLIKPFDIESRLFLKEFNLPPNTKLEIMKDGSFIKLHNEFYTVEIDLVGWSSGQGFDQNHPYYGNFVHRSSAEKFKLQEIFHNIKFDFKLQMELYFPIEDIEYYDSYHRFLKTINEVISLDWDYDNFINKLPNSMFYTLNSKMDEILSLLSKKNKL